MKKNYIFVCTGNICRSAMAEGIAKQLFFENNAITFSSFGVQALVGKSADSHAVAVCKEINVDISNHIARQLNIEELIQAEKIFCMDRGHHQFVSSLSPIIAEKTVLFLDYPTKKLFKKEVWDPYKMSLNKFRANRKLIQKQIEKMGKYL